jgi:hypothetical protein
MVRKQSKTHAASWSKPLLKWLGRYNWWECGFLALGALSLTGIIVILFMPIGKGPALMTADGPVPAVSNPAFASFVSEWKAVHEPPDWRCSNNNSKSPCISVYFVANRPFERERADIRSSRILIWNNRTFIPRRRFGSRAQSAPSLFQIGDED